MYIQSPASGSFRQGEILQDVNEVTFKLEELPQEIVTGGNAKIEVKHHPRTIVLSPDCDLAWDYQARKCGSGQDAKLMSHILLCDLEDSATLRETGRVKNNGEFRRVSGNREERYHYLPTSYTDSGIQIDEYYIDFKRIFALPAEYVIRESELGRITRLGILKPPWAQHLTHRFTFFLGRIGLPDEE